MFYILAILIIIASVLMIFVVLLQPGQGDMLAGLGGGLSNNLTSMFGSRKAMNFLTKITIGLAITILVLTLVTNKFFVTQELTIERPLIEGTQLPPSAPPATPTVPTVPPTKK
ncbi:MAG: preprotein translocase subunit SecG [Ignavibacteria bacterium GWF2_33_9]|nr:MAG: preprotein translocase subunit SecG [Ignavibacteria bacterium GWF2_33_9]